MHKIQSLLIHKKAGPVKGLSSLTFGQELGQHTTCFVRRTSVRHKVARYTFPQTSQGGTSCWRCSVLETQGSQILDSPLPLPLHFVQGQGFGLLGMTDGISPTLADYHCIGTFKFFDKGGLI
jgi:hypothetical protein